MARGKFMKGNHLWPNFVAVFAFLFLAGRHFWDTDFQAKFFLSVAVCLHVLQCFFGPARRCSSSSFIRYGSWAAYHLPFYLATYAASYTIFSYSHKSMDFMAWGIVLCEVLLPLSDMIVYTLGDESQHLLKLLKYRGYCLCFIVAVVYVAAWKLGWKAVPTVLRMSQVLLFLAFYGTTKPLADEPPFIPESSDDDIQNPLLASPSQMGVDMMCTYQTTLPLVHTSFFRGDDAQKWITMADMDREIDEEELYEVCLSFALFRQLAGHGAVMAGNPKALEFVLRLLSPEHGDGSQRTFKVVEVQLAFLYDYYFSSYSTSTIYFMEYLFQTMDNFMDGSIAACILSFGIFLEIIPCIIVSSFRGLGFALQTAAVALYFVRTPWKILRVFSSDWYKVWCATRYARGKSVPRASIVNLLGRLNGRVLFKNGYWQDRIGQYSVLSDCNRGNLMKAAIGRLALGFTVDPWWTSRSTMDSVHYPKEDEAVSLPEGLKRLLANALEQSQGRLTNGSKSLQENGFWGHFGWSFDQNCHTNTILIWHIATCYCEMAPSSSVMDDQVRSSTYYDVATKLSRYCAYLMAFVPELLPDGATMKCHLFQSVVKQAKTALRGASIVEEKFAMMERLPLPQDGSITFEVGVHLGKLLHSTFCALHQGQDRLWKVIADFWVENMLYLAPSDNFEAHVNHLAQGGEFITHLWALLSNAGITTRQAPAPVHLHYSLAQS